MKTPINESLTAFYQRSFAYVSIKVRLPTILSQTIDILSKKKENYLRSLAEEAEEEFKMFITQLVRLRSDMQSNKPLRKLVGEAPDIEIYNKALDLQSVKISQPTYFNATWLFVECYTYRRIMEAIEQTKLLTNIDPFQLQKEDMFYRTVIIMAPMANLLQDIVNSPDEEKEQNFLSLLKLNLWGNKCDLSLTLGRLKYETETMADLDNLNRFLLVDDSQRIWDALTECGESQIVDIILDNAGYELFTDMCIADYIIKNKYAERVRFYVKTLPWFVSDVTAKDFTWTLHQLKVGKNSTLKKIADRWNNYMRIKAWTVEEHSFWTLPFTYNEMAKWDLNLYRKLSEAKLIIFKGDLNYRKLFGEKNWRSTKSIISALQGFHPSKIGILRTLKAHIICGLPEGTAEDTEEKDSDWLITGKYGIIQYCDVIEKK